MKLTHLLAAGLMVAGLGVTSTAASAQDYRGDHREHRRAEHREVRNQGRQHGWNAHQRHCRTEWRHHRRVTVCYR